MRDLSLIELTVVTDDDTGISSIGEVDFRIHCTAYESFLKNYGFKGKTELIKMLSYFIYRVETDFRELDTSSGSECKKPSM